MHSNLAHAFLVVSVLLGFTPVGIAQENAVSEVAYGPLPTQKLLLCRPQTASARNPGVLLLHGGGWTGGNAEAFKGRCLQFAQHGFVSASVEYRLAGETAHWPAQLEDAELALQWLRAHSGEIGLDPDHICAFGASAGGHIALMLGAPHDRLACIVDAFGPTDLTAFSGPRYKRSLDALLGPEDVGREQRARDASPLFSLGPSFPPTLIIQGENDDLIPPEQSTALFEKLRRLKTPVVAIMYPGGHSWLGLNAQAVAAIINHAILFMKTAPRR
jgi:acetyl esterase/lipase